MKDLLSTDWDLTRAGVTLYLAGLLVSLIYYSQFGIFSLEILRPQCVLIGIFMLFFYGLLPLAILTSISSLRPRRLQIATALLVLALIDLLVLFFLRNDNQIALIAAITGLGLQVLLFCRRLAKGALIVTSPPESTRLLILLPLLAIHYAEFIHPSVPGHFGGGKPMTVDVYTDPQDLPANRFTRSKNRDRANKYRDSYRLHLLYETGPDYYFVEERRSNYALEGYAVTRLPKLKVIRLDYLTPSWVSMKGVSR
jgi:hypothetical protein